MPAAKAFLDSNIVLYLLSADTSKADRAEALVASGAFISVQVLNEVANVARRKLGMSWPEIHELLSTVRATCSCQPIAIEIHENGLRLAERYKLSIYDAMIVAAALQAGCNILYSEDLQNGLLIEKRLRVRNPF